METICRGLAEFGLPLIPPEAPEFGALVHDIESRPEPFEEWPPHDLLAAAVLLNRTGQAIILVSFDWRYTTEDGATHSSHCSNLGSGAQLDVLCGRAKAVRDLCQFILPGSKRLITEQGMLGNNLDVLGEDEAGRAGGLHGGGGGGRAHLGSNRNPIVKAELALDAAVLEDGLCVGPDEGGLFESLRESLEQVRNTAGEAAAALHDGASEGRIFEILLPLARRSPRPVRRERRGASTLSHMFASMAIHRLINESNLAEWVEGYVQTRADLLHRP